jgi:hypothetical protein
MTALAGLFLIAHGLVHLAVWLAPAAEDAPFDPAHSWLLGDAPGVARPLALVACALFVPAGVLVLVTSAAGAATAAAGAAVSLALVLLTYNRWLTAAVAINVAIAVVALA